MSSKLANKASHPSGRKAMQAVRASHKEERMKLHKMGAQLMLKPWHIKALWFKAALQDVLLEGQKSLTAVQWQQMCSMYISRNDDSIAQGDLASKVRRDEERRALADGVFVAPFLVARKDCELFIKWKGDAGGLNQIRGEKVPKFSMEEELLVGQSAAVPPSAPTGTAASGRVAHLLGGLDLGPSAEGDVMDDDDF